MRVLCITSSYPRHEHDISGCFVKRWREELERRGVEVKVLTWQLDREVLCVSCMMERSLEEVRYAPHAWQLLFHGAGAPENLARRPWLASLIPFAMVAMGWRAFQIVRAEPPDLIVGHWLLPSGFIARLLGDVCHTPSLIVTHSGGIAALDMLPIRSLTAMLARYLAGGPITFVSEQARSRFARLGVCSVATLPVVPMGFDPPAITKNTQHRTTSAPARDGILVLGRAVEIKGGEDVIEALARTRCCHDERRARLHIIGDGPALGGWSELARARGLDVTVHGTLTGRARDSVMARCRVAILGSRRMSSGREEGLPVSFLECAAAGIVPLVAHVPGAKPFLVNPELQCLDDSRSPATWARQIDALYARARDRDLVEAQQRAVAPLEWRGELGEKWLDVVTRAARGARE